MNTTSKFTQELIDEMESHRLPVEASDFAHDPNGLGVQEHSSDDSPDTFMTFSPEIITSLKLRMGDILKFRYKIEYDDFVLVNETAEERALKGEE